MNSGDDYSRAQLLEDKPKTKEAENSIETLTDPNIGVSRKALRQVPLQVNFRICNFFFMSGIVTLWSLICFNKTIGDK